MNLLKGARGELLVDRGQKSARQASLALLIDPWRERTALQSPKEQ
jgi:hypothetical protein